MGTSKTMMLAGKDLTEIPETTVQEHSSYFYKQSLMFEIFTF